MILPRLVGWHIHQNDKFFITFLIPTHLATAIVLLLFFWRDWARILKGLGRSLRDRGTPRGHGREAGPPARGRHDSGRTARHLLKDELRSVFALAQSAAIFLALTGCCSTAPSRFAAGAEDGGRRRHGIARQVGWRDSVLVGTAQALALIPGFSRSGAPSMGGGLLVGLSHKDAARSAFLLATPTSGGGRPEAPDLDGKTGNGVRGPARGALCSAVTAYLSVRFLMRYFETKTLTPFAVYCAAAGTACAIYSALE